MKRSLISIIVPVFDEEDNVVPLYQAVRAQLDKLSGQWDYEFIFTDNRSTDGTFARLQELAQADPNVRVARFSRNFGYQRSIYTGFCLARGDCALEIDCDFQDPPELIPEFIARWKEGFQVVYGVRTLREESQLMQFLRRCFYRFIHVLSEDPLPLDAGDFRLVDRKILDPLRMIHDASPYLRGAIAALGFNQIGIPYERAPRRKGKAKFNLNSLTALALDGILNHSILPLRCATFLGFFISLGLILYFIGLGVATIFWDVPWPRGFATTSTLILIAISLNAIFIGILGEYLGRIYRQTRNYPITVIDQTLNLEPPTLALPRKGGGEESLGFPLKGEGKL